LDRFITVARIVKPQGRRGEVAVELHTDFPERFADRRKLIALSASGDRRELTLQEFWGHKGRIVMKFAGVDSIAEAEKLIGCELQIPRQQRAVPTEGEIYISDLVGCEVISADGKLGVIKDVIFGAGEAPLLSIRAAENSTRELLVPLAQQYIRDFDAASKRLEMQLPNGMLDIDAPMTVEEKREQQNPPHRERDTTSTRAKKRLK
jgi:16S rRNA processing protein RimM